jgi:hypothetical protein
MSTALRRESLRRTRKAKLSVAMRFKPKNAVSAYQMSRVPHSLRSNQWESYSRAFGVKTLVKKSGAPGRIRTPAPLF